MIPHESQLMVLISNLLPSDVEVDCRLIPTRKSLSIQTPRVRCDICVDPTSADYLEPRVRVVPVQSLHGISMEVAKLLQQDIASIMVVFEAFNRFYGCGK